MFSEIYFSQKGSVVKETSNVHFLLFLIPLIQALTVSPFTSISQAPQLPVRQPVGISKPAFSAEETSYHHLKQKFLYCLAILLLYFLFLST